MMAHHLEIMNQRRANMIGDYYADLLTLAAISCASVHFVLAFIFPVSLFFDKLT